MAFAAESFYTLAHMLSRQAQGDDAHLRSCISRAYYGALIVARDHKQLSTRGAGGHDRVIDAYLAGNGAEAVIGDSLKQLKSLRHKADYEPHTPCASSDGSKALTYSSKVLKALGKMPQAVQPAPALPASPAKNPSP